MSESRGILFLDSDIFVLFAGAGLLPDLITAARFQLADARRLEPLPHMLQKGAMYRKYPARIRERAQAWCSQIPAIEHAPSPELLDRLVRFAEIDSGEALLFSLAAEMDRAVVATGDRRSCSKLSSADGLDDIRRMLKGRIICLENSLGLLLDQIAYTSLAAALTTVREYNRTLRILLPQGELTAEADFRTGLDSYLRDLKDQVGDLLRQRAPASSGSAC